VRYAYAPPGDGCGVTIEEVALYQGVKVSLGRTGVATRTHLPDVIARRPALVRVFVAAPPEGPVEATLRLTLRSGAGDWSLEVGGTVTAASRDDDMGSSFDFQIPAGTIAEDTTALVEVTAPGACNGPGAATRFPSLGELALNARATGVLKVRVVPLRYEADGSGRLPDTSEAEMARARTTLQAMFPVADVALDVRAPEPTGVVVTAEAGWTELLEQVRDLRRRDRAPDDVYYFGLVAPAADLGAYCGPGCVSGTSYRTDGDSPALHASVGLGYAGPVLADGMAHELGHAHGRKHAPCGQPPDPDPGFPHDDGAIGAWGWDARAPLQMIPPGTKDVMTYCGPRWVSPYTFQALAERMSQVIQGALPAPAAVSVADDRIVIDRLER
jgi:hypothetical protein